MSEPIYTENISLKIEFEFIEHEYTTPYNYDVINHDFEKTVTLNYDSDYISSEEYFNKFDLKFDPENIVFDTRRVKFNVEQFDVKIIYNEGSDFEQTLTLKNYHICHPHIDLHIFEYLENFNNNDERPVVIFYENDINNFEFTTYDNMESLIWNGDNCFELTGEESFSLNVDERNGYYEITDNYIFELRGANYRYEKYKQTNFQIGTLE